MMKKIIVLFVLAVAALSFVQSTQQLLIPGKGIEGYVTVGGTTSTEIKTKFGAGYKEINHYSELNGSKSLYSVERRYARQGVSFYFKPNNDTVFLVKVKLPYAAKTDKGIVLGTSTMQQVRDAYGAADFYADGPNMFLEYPGIKFYTTSGSNEADVLKQKVTIISITEF
jgi:hypothetical protein